MVWPGTRLSVKRRSSSTCRGNRGWGPGARGFGCAGPARCVPGGRRRAAGAQRRAAAGLHSGKQHLLVPEHAQGSQPAPPCCSACPGRVRHCTPSLPHSLPPPALPGAACLPRNHARTSTYTPSSSASRWPRQVRGPAWKEIALYGDGECTIASHRSGLGGEAWWRRRRRGPRVRRVACRGPQWGTWVRAPRDGCRLHRTTPRSQFLSSGTPATGEWWDAAYTTARTRPPTHHAPT